MFDKNQRHLTKNQRSLSKTHETSTHEEVLTFSYQRSLSYRNQSIDLPSKSMDWFLYDRDLRHERVNEALA